MRDAAATEMIMAKQPKLDTFTRSYIETALWSTHDESDEGGGEHLDENYGVSDFAPETLERVMRDTEQFQRENAEALEVIDSAGAGHDFWLTRNGHGAGFWDGDWPEPQATLLTKASKRMGEVDLYVGDDGQLYMTPGRREAEGHARRLDKDALEGVGKDPRFPLGAPPGPASGFGKERTEADYRARIEWEAWAAREARKRGHEAIATGHDLARVAYGRELERKFPRGVDGLGETSGRFSVGERVQLHPGTNRWMMGDRYGEVVKVTREYVHVKLDKSGKTLKFSEGRLLNLDGSMR
jgi:hypothetical protein